MNEADGDAPPETDVHIGTYDAWPAVIDPTICGRVCVIKVVEWKGGAIPRAIDKFRDGRPLWQAGQIDIPEGVFG